MENTFTILDIYNYLTCCHLLSDRCSNAVQGLKKWLKSKGYDLSKTIKIKIYCFGCKMRF